MNSLRLAKIKFFKSELFNCSYLNKCLESYISDNSVLNYSDIYDTLINNSFLCVATLL